MIILFVNEYAGFVGGVEQNIALCVRALKERGHHCHLLFSRRAKGAEEYLELFSGSSDQLGRAGERDYLQLLSPHVAYLHRVPTVESFLGQSFRTVRMVHDHDLCCPRRHKYHPVSNKVCTSRAGWRCWLDLAFLQRTEGGIGWRSLARHQANLRENRKLDHLLVGSRAMLEELLQNGFKREQVQVLAPAVPPSAGLVEGDGSTRGVLYVGQMIRGKGPDLLLRALALMAPDVELTMVGEGNWLSHLKQLANKLGVGSRVRWQGWVTPEQLQAHYRRARVVAVPSRWPEPFGMVGLEAMQNARPVVAFDVGGIPDWLQDGVNGRLVRPPSIEGFARALCEFTQDEELANSTGLAGLELVRRRFAFPRYIEELESALYPSIGVAV